MNKRGKIKNLKEYQKLCQRTAQGFEDREKEILTWGLGVAGEAGDLAGCIKKTFSHKNDQTSGIRENLGDTLWYMAMICNFFNWDFGEVLTENIEKLKKRYPQGFSKKAAKRKRRDWSEEK
ncbi:MAG: nucleoside triphosphate pyrophosphohydrolase family protein [bacterium]